MFWFLYICLLEIFLPSNFLLLKFLVWSITGITIFFAKSSATIIWFMLALNRKPPFEMHPTANARKMGCGAYMWYFLYTGKCCTHICFNCLGHLKFVPDYYTNFFLKWFWIPVAVPPFHIYQNFLAVFFPQLFQFSPFLWPVAFSLLCGEEAWFCADNVD